VASVKGIVAPTQTLDAPVIGSAFGAALTVMVFVVDTVPHELVTLYMMVSIPPVTPVTMPPATVAEALLLLHVPPATASVRVIVEPMHTLEGPVILPAFDGLTVTVRVALQPPVNAYIIVDVPVATPETIPEPLPTVATDVLLLVQLPPAMASLNVIVDPAQTVAGPAVVMGAGAEFTVIFFVVKTVPQRLVTVYLITSVPGASPVTTPVTGFTEAVVLLLLHTPPGDASVNAIDEPTHTAESPVMVPTVVGETVTVVIALHPAGNA
jgi:hypothetical protein